MTLPLTPASPGSPPAAAVGDPAQRSDDPPETAPAKLAWKRRALIRLASICLPSVLRALVRAASIEFHGSEHLQSLRERGGPFMYAVWHGRIAAPIVVHREEGVAVMVSLHGDGELIARVLHSLGFLTIRGSSSRAGKAAFAGMVEHLRRGGVGAIIPDGPRGPRHCSKSGIVRIASAAGGVPILPMSFSARPAKLFSSWDRMLLPRAWGRVVQVYGKPLEVPDKILSETELEKLRAELDRRLTAVEAEADQLVAAPPRAS